MIVEIKSVTRKVLYSCEALSIKECLELAVKDNADLWNADLRNANLVNANLWNANLRNADLRDADLMNADGKKVKFLKQPIQIDTGQYHVVIFYHGDMRIGCEYHSLADWREFDDRRIGKMDGKAALSFWAKWKEPLMGICEIYSDARQS